MGVHDFVCHVERNGQCLIGPRLLDKPMTTNEELVEQYGELDEDDRISMLEELMEYDDVGSDEACLVLLPRSMTREQVERLSFVELAKYPTRLEKYNWDMWDFPNYPGYSLFLSDGLSVWHNHDHWIINFHPITYDVFVKGAVPPEQIGIGWYLHVLENRGRELDSLDKRELYRTISSPDH